MSILIALTLSIGVLSVVATWLFLGPLAALNFQIWQAFIGWACFYHCGGKTDNRNSVFRQRKHYSFRLVRRY